MNENKKVCANCALCSFDCSIDKIACDVDYHAIIDEYTEGCEDEFIECSDK